MRTDLAEELLATVREICRADGAVPAEESSAIDALALRLEVSGNPEDAFFRRTSPRRLAAVVADLLAQQGDAYDADDVPDRLLRMAEAAARSDGRFSREEEDALAAFVGALRPFGRR